MRERMLTSASRLGISVRARLVHTRGAGLIHPKKPVGKARRFLIWACVCLKLPRVWRSLSATMTAPSLAGTVLILT